MNAATLQRIKKVLVFNVAREETRDGITGLPGIKLIQCACRNTYSWTLPSLGPEYDFGIGWEMGLAYLRAHLWAGGLDNPEAYAISGAGSLPFIAEALFHDHAPDGHRAAFFDCIAIFHDYALNAPHQVMDAIVARLIALDDSALRARCLAVIEGQPVADIFDPEGLGWKSCRLSGAAVRDNPNRR